MSSAFLVFILCVMFISAVLSFAYMMYTIKIQQMQSQKEMEKAFIEIQKNNLKNITNPQVDYLSRWRLVKNGDSWEKVYEAEVLDINDYR